MDSLSTLAYSALGSRSKRLSDYCFEQVKQVYDALSITFDPVFYPYVSHISRFSGDTIVDLAKGLGISQPAASKMLKRIAAARLVSVRSDKADKRTKRLYLTQTGERELFRIRPVLEALNQVMAAIDTPQPDLLAGMASFEQAFSEISLKQRVLHHLLKTFPLQLADYSPDLQSFYETHNRIWIQRNFILEETDIAALTDPQGQVLSKGGRIYIVRLGDYPVGGFSLLDEGSGNCQFSKMYVPEALHGHGIGNRLLPLAIEEARRLGFSQLYLLSNTRQEPAIHLYRKTGFSETPMSKADRAKFARANIRMAMPLVG